MSVFARRPFAFPALAVALSVLATSAPAAAQSAADKAAAESLFDEGKKLMIQGQFAPACDRLEQSQRIDPGIGTLLYLAECYEKSGRSASAWATFREATSAARAAGQNERARQGQARADRLEPALSRLTITVAPENGSTDGFEVRRGKELLPRSLWNVALPVDPGEVVIEARAPGRKTFSQTIKVGDQAARASVAVPALEVDPDAPAATPAPAPTPAGEPPPATTSGTANASLTSDVAPPDGKTQRTIAYVLGGVGVVGLGVGTVFGLKAMSKNSDAEKLCEGSSCQPQAEPLTDDAKSAAMVSNVAFGVGAAALIGGAVLYFTAPKEQSTARARRLHLTPTIGSRGAAVLLGGAF